MAQLEITVLSNSLYKVGATALESTCGLNATQVPDSNITRVLEPPRAPAPVCGPARRSSAVGFEGGRVEGATAREDTDVNLAAALAIIILAQSALAPSVIVARPEVPHGNVVRVGQTLVVPLYDGELAPLSRDYPAGLRLVGPRRITKHDLRRDLGTSTMFGGHDASSERGVAFIVERPGAGSVNVLLRLPHLKEPCSSCRTLHFFYTVRRD